MAEKQSSAGKWLALGCLIPLGLVILAVVAVFAFGSYFWNKNLSMDPAEVERQARTVMDYRIPGGSVGQIRISMLGTTVYMVQSKALPPDATLMLALSPEVKGPGASEKVEQAITRRNSVPMTVKSLRRVPGQLCARRVTLTVKEGYLSRAGKRVPVSSTQGIVAFGGKMRFAMVHGIGKGARARANRIWASLRCK